MFRSFAPALVVAALAFANGALAQDDLVSSPKGAFADDHKDEGIDDSKVPNEQKDQLKLFTGTWKCSGKANTDYGVDVATNITLAFKSDLGGRWISLRLEESKSKLNPNPVVSSEFWGFSKVLGGLVRSGADNLGGFYDGSSNGWVGDRLWWNITSSRGGKKVQLKDTFTKVSDKELTFERALDPTGTGGDAFRVTFEGSCKR